MQEITRSCLMSKPQAEPLDYISVTSMTAPSAAGLAFFLQPALSDPHMSKRSTTIIFQRPKLHIKDDAASTSPIPFLACRTNGLSSSNSCARQPIPSRSASTLLASACEALPVRDSFRCTSAPRIPARACPYLPRRARTTVLGGTGRRRSQKLKRQNGPRLDSCPPNSLLG